MIPNDRCGEDPTTVDDDDDDHDDVTVDGFISSLHTRVIPTFEEPLYSCPTIIIGGLSALQSYSPTSE